jgi:hypothetical protein
MSTFREYRQACLRAAQEGIIPYSICTTTAGSANAYTLTDTTRLQNTSTGADDTRYEQMYAYLLAGGYTGQVLNENRQIKTGGYAPATGILTLNASYGGNPLTAKSFELHKFAPPETLERAINYALRSMRYKAFAPLTLIADGDMELSTKANWTDSASATSSKVTTAGYVYSGTRSLEVVNTVANHYTQSDAISVVENDVYLVSAIAQCAIGTAKLVAWDVTNGEEIDSWTSDEMAWMEFRKTITIPTDCKQVALRLQGVEATADIYWDCAILVPQNAQVMDVPSWMLKPEHVQEVYYFPVGGAAGDAYLLKQREPVRWGGYNLLEEVAGTLPWRLTLSPAIGDRVPWLLAYRPYAELASEADTSAANMDEVVARTLAHFFKNLGPTYAAEYAQWRGEIKPQRPSITWRSAYG